MDNFYAGGCTWSLVHDEEMVNARKRRKKGQQPLDEQSFKEPEKDLEKEWATSWPPTIANDDGEDILDPESDERALMNELEEMRETLERLYWEP